MKHIMFNGKSDGMFGGVFIERVQRGKVTPRYRGEKLPFRDGELNCSRVGGKLYYEPREMTYDLIVSASSCEALENKLASVREWLTSDGDNTLFDDNIPGWKYTGVQCIDMQTEYIDMYMTTARLSVRFTADPYMVNTSDSTQRRL